MFFNCVNSLKLSILYKKKGFFIPKNKNNLDLLKVFLKLNLIRYIKINERSVYVNINYVNNKPVFNNITNLFKPGHKLYISLKNLKKVCLKHNWILILSTNKGIINSYDAMNQKVGGLLITKFWN